MSNMTATPDMFLPIESDRLSDKAVGQIKALIEEGRLKPGDKLPAERELIKRLSVSRASLREALRVLEVLGLIEVRTGIGAFVKQTDAGALPAEWSALLIKTQQEVIDLLEVREALEARAVELAVQKASEEDLEGCSLTLAKMKQSANTNDVDAAIQSDIEFHQLISKMSQNKFLIELSDSISHVLLDARYAFFRQPNRILVSWQQHCRVVEALVKRDSQAAAEAMLQHLQDSKEVVKRLG
ncbi:MAG: FadR/GntR family transcriptional regulator [Chloroflexi bacterium]|nr:FadR/GntR family transcriptional regulator [Chloroflexota bacterium]